MSIVVESGKRALSALAREVKDLAWGEHGTKYEERANEAKTSRRVLRSIAQAVSAHEHPPPQQAPRGNGGKPKPTQSERRAKKERVRAERAIANSKASKSLGEAKIAFSNELSAELPWKELQNDAASAVIDPAPIPTTYTPITNGITVLSDHIPLVPNVQAKHVESDGAPASVLGSNDLFADFNAERDSHPQFNDFYDPSPPAKPAQAYTSIKIPAASTVISISRPEVRPTLFSGPSHPIPAWAAEYDPNAFLQNYAPLPNHPLPARPISNPVNKEAQLPSKLERIQKIVGRKYENVENLYQAVPTLKSSGNYNNTTQMRMALAGDKVLALLLVDKHLSLGLSSGQITHKCQELWSNAALTAFGRRAGLQPFARGGGKKAVADLVEALIGAAYLEDGLNGASDVMRNLKLL